jgi:hypothetical protein
MRSEEAMTKAFALSSIISLFVVACAAEQGELNGGPGGGGGDNGGMAGDGENAGGDGHGTTGGEEGTGTVPGATPGANLCKGEPHIGFANLDFAADRKDGEVGINRRRVKPYSALSSEFQRTLGKVPTNLATSAAAYGEVPARWYVEPDQGAVAAYTTYQLAFATCYEQMTQPEYTMNPTATTAPAMCTTWQRKVWQRTATPDETKACADFVLGLTDEPLARRRWAHACASIHSAIGFTTY